MQLLPKTCQKIINISSYFSTINFYATELYDDETLRLIINILH